MNAIGVAEISGIAALLAAVFGFLAWRDSRPFQPFEVTEAAGGVFGLQRTGAGTVWVERAWIPHHGGLRIANESAHEGPWKLRRGAQVHLALEGGVQAPVDIALEWRRAGVIGRLPILRKPKYWTTHVLP